MTLNIHGDLEWNGHCLAPGNGLERYGLMQHQLSENNCFVTNHCEIDIICNISLMIAEPNPVNAITVLNRNTTSVTLSWDQPLNHKPENIYMVALNGNLSTILTGNEFITVTQLNPGTRYMFSVFTLTADNTSADPANVSSTTGENDLLWYLLLCACYFGRIVDRPILHDPMWGKPVNRLKPSGSGFVLCDEISLLVLRMLLHILVTRKNIPGIPIFHPSKGDE